MYQEAGGGGEAALSIWANEDSPVHSFRFILFTIPIYITARLTFMTLGSLQTISLLSSWLRACWSFPEVAEFQKWASASEPKHQGVGGS